MSNAAHAGPMNPASTAPAPAPRQGIRPRPFMGIAQQEPAAAPRTVGTAPRPMCTPSSPEVVSPTPAPSVTGIVAAVEASNVDVPLAPQVPAFTTLEGSIPAPPMSGVGVRSRASRSTPASSTRPLVVLADRDAAYRARLATRLRAFCDVEEADDDRAARELCAEGRPPALVITEVHLREGDGFDLARALRGESTLAKVPLLLLSAHPTATEVLEGVRLGVRAHLAKETGLEPITARIRLILRA